MKLKPCPFCGGEARFYEASYYAAQNISCIVCPAMVESSEMSEEQLREAWNKRAKESE